MLDYSLLTETELIELSQLSRKKMVNREGETQKQTTPLDWVKDNQKRERAFRVLLKKHYALIKKLVNFYSKSHQKRYQKDLKQEAIIAFYEAITQFDKSRKVKLSTWIFYRIRTKLKAISQQIKKQERIIKQVRINLEARAILEEESRFIQLKKVLVLLCQLTEKQQEVVNLQLKGGSWAAIAKTLNSTPEAVRMVWNRAVKRLRKLLTNQSKK